MSHVAWRSDRARRQYQAQPALRLSRGRASPYAPWAAPSYSTVADLFTSAKSVRWPWAHQTCVV
eukprot:6184547-Pleurochrysis_carterae.AAC.3